MKAARSSYRHENWNRQGKRWERSTLIGCWKICKATAATLMSETLDNVDETCNNGPVEKHIPCISFVYKLSTILLKVNITVCKIYIGNIS